MTRKLPSVMHEKPWGVTALPKPFESHSGSRIGEIWFDPPPNAPLLVKYLFTSERLSIQVHPDDDQARREGHTSGKEECWLIIDALPGAMIGIGTTRTLAETELRAACLSGEIEGLIQWHPVVAGMFFHIPPGTIHAIGGGISLIEIQQNSDITYRLYDYGRPRPLHLREATKVATARPMAPSLRQTVNPSVTRTLVSTASLHVVHISGHDGGSVVNLSKNTYIVPISGSIIFGDVEVAAGECAVTDKRTPVMIGRETRFLAASIVSIS